MEGNTLLRTHQYAYRDNEIGRKIEQNKILNQRNALKKIRSKNEYVKEGVGLLNEMVEKLDATQDYLTIMGVEGNAAKVYFPRIFDCVNWNGRKPRIKSDYLNVTLDIGYTMLFNMRKSLVCDLMEPMRPIIDYAVRKAIRLGQCKADDFGQDKNRWYLEWKNNPAYIRFLMEAILEYKDAIFLYVQQYYRFFMKMKSVEKMPLFLYE